ncbi:MAG: AAA-like domain-containing protein [Calothrix sp. MO_167.B42]|nr:AAA-like domain-containing protein [Calothrix sp. MO_167.B42]
MNLNFLIEIIDHQLVRSQNHPLNSTEIIILRGIWQYRTYNQIAIEAGYSPGYFTNVVAPELYHRLSELIGERVNKKNCRTLLEYYAGTQVESTESLIPKELLISPVVDPDKLPDYPSGSISLNSPFYLKRSIIEEKIYQEIRKPGALIRVKAPREMGKTSLLLRIIDYGNRLGYCTVSLNLEQVEHEVVSNLNQFLRWLCANIARQLQFKPMLDEYWDEDMGSKISCTLFLQDYILESIDAPLVLAFDETNRVFEYPRIAKDFLPLLRSWYEETKRLPVWRKLRLLVVHSTDIYVPLDLDQSPFNVGLPIQLNYFTPVEVRELARRYGLDWEDGQEAEQLMAVVEGHPALVHLALYHLNQGKINLSQLIETAANATGIYSHHLQRHWVTLEKQPELVQALYKVFNATEPVYLSPTLTHKLSSMGLIKLSGSEAMAGCELYRQFFTNKEKQHCICTSSPP